MRGVPRERRAISRRSEQPGAGGGAHQGERRQVELDGARRGSLADHDVELVVLHRGIEDLLHHRVQPVDLVDEQDVAGLEVREQRGEVAGALEHRPRGLAQVHPELVRGDDVRERGLAEPGRSEHQQVIQRLAARRGGADEDLHLLAHHRLAHVLVETLRAKRPLHGVLALGGERRDQPVLGHGFGVRQSMARRRAFRARNPACSLCPDGGTTRAARGRIRVAARPISRPSPAARDARAPPAGAPRRPAPRSGGWPPGA